jgi:hypothetical protein
MECQAAHSVIGRDSELASVAGFLDQPRSGLAATLIEGDVDIGKTTRWQESLQGAHATPVAIRPAITTTVIPHRGDRGAWIQNLDVAGVA